MPKRPEISPTRRHALAILSVAAAQFLALQPGPAEAREYRADLTRYCNQMKMSGWGFYKKKPYFRCQRLSWGFNTQYVSKTRPISLADVCRRQHRTGKWRSAGKNVFCIGETHSVLKLCNRSGADIHTAFAAYDDRHGLGGWTSYGWYKAPARGCTTVSLQREYSGQIYVYAEGGGNEWNGRDAALCIHEHQGFRLVNAGRRRCDTNGHRRVGMSAFTIRPGTNIWTFR